MFEWWQTVILSLATLAMGGLITLVAARYQHGLSTAASREAEERESTRRVREEERQARRQYRRDRVKPVQDFLEAAKEFLAAGSMASTLANIYEQGFGDVKDTATLDQFREAILQTYGFRPLGETLAPMMQNHQVATASAPTEEIREQLMRVLQAVIATEKRGYEVKAERAVDSAEQLIERYVTEV